jgi:hypothetical protein
MEQRISHINVKGKTQAGKSLVRSNTDVICEVGLGHSSKEASVMGVERRTEVIRLSES